MIWGYLEGYTKGVVGPECGRVISSGQVSSWPLLPEVGSQKLLGAVPNIAYQPPTPTWLRASLSEEAPNS